MIKSVRMPNRIIQICEDNRDDIKMDYSDMIMSIYIYIRERTRRIE